MIVKWEEATGVSYFDFVIKVTKLKDDGSVIRLTQATLDQKLVTYDFTEGEMTLVSDKGATIETWRAGE